MDTSDHNISVLTHKTSRGTLQSLESRSHALTCENIPDFPSFCGEPGNEARRREEEIISHLS